MKCHRMKSIVASVIASVVLGALIVGAAVWLLTEPLDDNLGVRCAGCSAGQGVWVFMGTPYPSLSQIEVAGLAGIVLGLALPLPRRYEDGPVMFGVRTRRRRRAVSRQAPLSRLLCGMSALDIFDRQATLAMWVLFFVFSTIVSVQSYAAYTTGTAHAQIAPLRKGAETMYVQTLGPCQGRHCFWCWLHRLETAGH